jgi:hypothetical protein
VSERTASSAGAYGWRNSFDKNESKCPYQDFARFF